MVTPQNTRTPQLTMAFSIPFDPIRYPYHTFRTLIVQPLFWAVFMLSPLFHVFQLDVIHQRMIFLGHPYPFEPWALGWVPIVFFSGVITIGVICVFWGRLFCGWACPHNTLTEWLQPIRMLIGIGTKPHWVLQWEKQWPILKPAHVILSLTWGLAVTLAISQLFLTYFIPLDWYFGLWQQGTPSLILLWCQGILVLIGLFLLYAGHEFCRSACPYGLLQSLSAYFSDKWSPMEIRYKEGQDFSACKSCRGCQSACPVDIDPRTPENLLVGIGEGCFNCGKCIDACKSIHPHQNYESYLSFQAFQSVTESRELAE